MFSSFLVLFFLVWYTVALPARSRRCSARSNDQLSTVGIRGNVDGTIGLGDKFDLLYSVPIQLGGTTMVVNLDTGSSDLWVISSNCVAKACAKTKNITRIPASTLKTTGGNVTMRYGDSKTGTYASGPIAMTTAAIAGVSIENQLFAAIDDTTNTVVKFGAAGIFGLGFPSESRIQAAAVLDESGETGTTDNLIASSFATGPLISRIAQSGALQMPMFSISLQRSTIDISGKGALTLGTLPPGVDNSSLTWVPVRLYSPAEGGLAPPTFAASEVYPLRWEIDLDGVFLDGVEIPASNIPATGGVSSTRMSALIDTGNSLLRGPSDVVDSILSTISPDYKATVPNSATVACAKAHNLTFKIGGQLFPIDPRDLVGSQSKNEARTCVVDNLVGTDAPDIGTLFRWSLGDPFMKSNLVVFHYGNLTNPSQDPPRIGFLSQVPTNASALLAQAVQDALEDGGHFENTLVLAPTNVAATEAQVTVVASAASLQAAKLTAAHTVAGHQTPATRAVATRTPATHVVAVAAVTPTLAAPTTPKSQVPPAKSRVPPPASSAAPNGNTNLQKPNMNAAARGLGIWDPWLVTVALGVAIFTSMA
ncbi:aspartic peptidase domain-containing protein [Mycena alexandri]|uniref:Aspartic peptidase domain-containing protein n=1 Tax=Mycena alexandri TaxID=1745969 RepID=A0AAD6XDG7_9AGAR|nr:aspartic peptidase domain-containing protein [Mycena alexandri]